MNTTAARDVSIDPLAPNPRHVQLLGELTELGMELAREVQTLTKSRIVEARESGWDGNLPKDPAGPFARIAQCVRRTIALEIAIQRGGVRAGERSDALFAPPDRGVDLNPALAVWENTTLSSAADRPLGEAAQPPDGPADIAAIVADDLGSALEDRERFFERPIAPLGVVLGDLCRDLELDLDRLAWRPGGWVVCGDPKDAASIAEVPLRSWRPARGSALCERSAGAASAAAPAAPTANPARLE